MGKPIGVSFKSEALQIIKKAKGIDENRSDCINRLIIDAYSASLRNEINKKNVELLECKNKNESLQGKIKGQKTKTLTDMDNKILLALVRSFEGSGLTIMGLPNGSGARLKELLEMVRSSS